MYVNDYVAVKRHYDNVELLAVQRSAKTGLITSVARYDELDGFDTGYVLDEVVLVGGGMYGQQAQALRDVVEPTAEMKAAAEAEMPRGGRHGARVSVRCHVIEQLSEREQDGTLIIRNNTIQVVTQHGEAFPATPAEAVVAAFGSMEIVMISRRDRCIVTVGIDEDVDFLIIKMFLTQ